MGLKLSSTLPARALRGRLQKRAYPSRKVTQMRSIAVFLASIAFGFAQASQAQDLPSRVGRLAYMQGPVSVYQDPDLGWDKAYVNTPIAARAPR